MLEAGKPCPTRDWKYMSPNLGIRPQKAVPGPDEDVQRNRDQRRSGRRKTELP